MSTKRAVIRPQRGHSTTRLGFDTSTYRVFFEAATVDFGFYPVTAVARRSQFGRPIYLPPWQHASARLSRRSALAPPRWHSAPAAGQGGVPQLFPHPFARRGATIRTT